MRLCCLVWTYFNRQETLKQDTELRLKVALRMWILRSSVEFNVEVSVVCRGKRTRHMTRGDSRECWHCHFLQISLFDEMVLFCQHTDNLCISCFLRQCRICPEACVLGIEFLFFNLEVGTKRLFFNLLDVLSGIRAGCWALSLPQCLSHMFLSRDLFINRIVNF